MLGVNALILFNMVPTDIILTLDVTASMITRRLLYLTRTPVCAWMQLMQETSLSQHDRVVFTFLTVYITLFLLVTEALWGSYDIPLAALGGYSGYFIAAPGHAFTRRCSRQRLGHLSFISLYMVMFVWLGVVGAAMFWGTVMFTKPYLMTKPSTRKAMKHPVIYRTIIPPDLGEDDVLVAQSSGEEDDEVKSVAQSSGDEEVEMVSGEEDIPRI